MLEVALRHRMNARLAVSNSRSKGEPAVQPSSGSSTILTAPGRSRREEEATPRALTVAVNSGRNTYICTLRQGFRR